MGAGPGSYATLTAAIAAAVAGDRILVLNSTTEPTGDLSLSVADVAVRCMPGASVGLSGALTNGLRLTAARVRLEDFRLGLSPTGTQARGLSVEAADCSFEGRIETVLNQTYTDLVHITSGGVRAFIRAGVLKTLGTITALETNNDGAGSSVVYGG